ncbi:hypothetical protein CYMTET_13751 [Cymbomonas tetramitiformis]|uniref:Kinesin motor domain-containing protein n=1 Tax=Cymbomonas tetramitiformis TaxID=36881 RepID=A0AAE0LB25_9CHLO|nr:hypothetical protein CYMTET_13751 [Cymbomonas tetramitiformis]
MDDSGRGRVNVFVRIRPPLPREEGEPSCLTVDEGETNITLQMQDGDAVERVLAGGSFQNSPLEKKFAFDGCFDGESEQKEVFVAVGKPVLRDVISGYNGCILAYGQTGAGKTHSLLNAGGRSPQEAGLLPRTIAALFVHIGSDTQNVYNVEVGTFQLYNEQVDDLLAEAGEGTRGRNLNVVNSGEVQGLTWLPCKTPEELLQAFQRGRNNIVYAETKMNKASSRSHAVFQIKESGGVEEGEEEPLTLLEAGLSDRHAGNLCGAGRNERRRGFATEQAMQLAGQGIVGMMTASARMAQLLSGGRDVGYFWRGSKPRNAEMWIRHLSVALAWERAGLIIGWAEGWCPDQAGWRRAAGRAVKRRGDLLIGRGHGGRKERAELGWIALGKAQLKRRTMGRSPTGMDSVARDRDGQRGREHLSGGISMGRDAKLDPAPVRPGRGCWRGGFRALLDGSLCIRGMGQGRQHAHRTAQGQGVGIVDAQSEGDSAAAGGAGQTALPVHLNLQYVLAEAGVPLPVAAGDEGSCWEEAASGWLVNKFGRGDEVAGKAASGLVNNWPGEAGRMASQLLESMEDVRREAENLRMAGGQGQCSAEAWSGQEQSGASPEQAMALAEEGVATLIGASRRVTRLLEEAVGTGRTGGESVERGLVVGRWLEQLGVQRGTSFSDTAAVRRRCSCRGAQVIKRARATENKGAAVKMKATVGKLTVVDLAGSERVKRSGVSGQQLKEAANINTSLLAFGNVVQALADKKKFIPFRDSKLTRILQDSIGGNSKTSLLVCTSPAAESCSETSSTLEFASRAMRVEITATLNQVDVTVDPSKLAADLAGEGIDKALLEQQRANEAKEKVMEQREARAKKDAEASKALALKAQQDGAKKETEIKELNLKWEKKVEAALLKGAEGKSELETQVKQLKQQLREQEENSEAKLKLLEMQARVGTLEKALQTATSTSAKADAQRDEEYAQQLAALELELQTTHTQWQEDGAARGEAEAKCQRMAAEADAQQQQMDEMKAKFEQETEKLLQQQQAELLAVDARHVEEIEKQICKVRSQYEEAAAAATTAHAAEVKILETEYATELSQLDDLRKHQLMEQELEWKARYVAHEEELQAQLAREKEALGLEKDAEIASLGAKSALQDEAIHELEERKDELHTQLLAAKKAEMEVKLTMEEVVKRLEEESQMVSKKHQSEMEAVRERQAAELQSVTQQADTQQRRTSGLFNSARGVLALKMDVLQASFNSLQERFEQRESRPEDVERIKELETELNTTIEQMRQHHAYSSHLQRQLDNRDENDKVFGGGPAKKAPASLPALKTPKPLGANPMPRRHAGQSVLGSQFKMNR